MPQNLRMFCSGRFFRNLLAGIFFRNLLPAVAFQKVLSQDIRSIARRLPHFPALTRGASRVLLEFGGTFAKVRL
jgi:hypothetical protein